MAASCPSRPCPNDEFSTRAWRCTGLKVFASPVRFIAGFEFLQVDLLLLEGTIVLLLVGPLSQMLAPPSEKHRTVHDAE